MQEKFQFNSAQHDGSASDDAENALQLVDYVRMNNRKGALNYLRNLSKEKLIGETLRAGFAVRSQEKGRTAVLVHLMKQFDDVRKNIDKYFP